MTFTVVALERATGELGIAVHSCYPGVAGVVSHVEHGVGAVATQAAGDPRLAQQVLGLLGEGRSPSEAIEQVLAADSAPATRQLAVVSASGETGAHTGSNAIGHAEHIVGEGYVVAANIATSPELFAAMSGAYLDHAHLRLPDRLLRCLEAAQASGGDLRGPLSAGLLVVGGRPARLDVRIDLSADPIGDLARAAGDIRAYALVEPSLDEVVELARTPQPLFWFLLEAAGREGADLHDLARRMHEVVERQPGLGAALDRMESAEAQALRAHLTGW